MGAGPDSPRPNSTAAASAFYAALNGAPLATWDFEDVPIIGGGKSYVITDPASVAEVYIYEANPQKDVITNDPGTALTGYNTTVGGSKYLSINPTPAGTDVNFHFDSGHFGSYMVEPHAIGAYYSGLATTTGGITLALADRGANNRFPLVLPIGTSSTSPLGGVGFFGVIDADNIYQYALESYDTSTQTFSTDPFAIDDLVFSPPVNYSPEPGTWGLTLGGMIILGIGVKRRLRERGLRR